MILSEEQYKVLDDIGVFDKINEKCDIIIDDYEEEVLELDKIPMALEIVNQLINSNSNVSVKNFTYFNCKYLMIK